MKRVSVVISIYSRERADDVRYCIESLKNQTMLPTEIILVLDPDKALTDFYKARVPNDVKVIVSEDFGLSNARNNGIKNAEGEIIAFIDDDAIAEQEWLANLVKNYDDPSVAGVGGLIKPVWEDRRPYWFPEELYWTVGCSYKGLPEKRALVRNPIGCNMSFKRSTFEKVGLFKTNVGRVGKKPLGSEEMEFSLRVLDFLPEESIMFDPSAVVYHKVPRKRASLKYISNRSFYEGLSKALVSASQSPEAMSTENSYLRYLLRTTIPSKLKRVYKFESSSQLFILTASTCLVLVGYLIGHFARSAR